MSERDTVAMLCAWGEWSRTGGIQLRAKSQMLIVMQLVQPNASRSPPDISDDEAMLVEGVVNQLRKHNTTLHEVVKMYFILGWSIREISIRLKISRDAAGKLFERACGWVDCGINFSDAA